MPKPNDELLERILEDQPPTLTPRQRFREATARWFKERKGVFATVGTVVGLVGLAMLYRGGLVLHAGLRADRTDLIANGSWMLMLGLAAPIFCILWSRMARYSDMTLEQLLLLRLELSQLEHGQPADSPEAGAPVELGALLPDPMRDEFSSRWKRVSMRIAAWVSGIAFLIMSVAAILTLTLSPLDRRASSISQVDEWRIAAADRVVARSRIRFERPPRDSRFVTLALPYGATEITSVTADDRSLPFSKLDWRRYEVEIPNPPFPWRPPEVLVTWEFPADRLATGDGTYGTWLSALLPVNAYRLEVVVDEGSGYEVVGRPESGRLVPFAAWKQSDKTVFGRCQISVQKKQEQQETPE